MRVFLPALLIACISALAGSAADDWAHIVALDAGPGKKPATTSEALGLALGHTAVQEGALRDFLAKHSMDGLAFEARIRLARVLSIRAGLKNTPMPEEALFLLDAAARFATTPAQKAEVDFTRLAVKLRGFRDQRPASADRRTLLDQTRAFQRDHPQDRRIPALLMEVSTLFEGDSRQKLALINDAARLTRDPDLLAQIADDRQRHALLGKPLPLRFIALDGTRVEASSWVGKPALIVFFNSAEATSRAAWQAARDAAEAQGAALGGIALDAERATLEKFATEQKCRALVAWDGKGWESELIKVLGLNAVPAVWLLDKEGALRSLDALDDPAALLRRLSR